MDHPIAKNYITPSHPTAFGSPGNIQKYYKKHEGKKYSRKQIEKILGTLDSYNLHREVKKPHVRNPVFVYAKRDQIQMDLIDIHRYKDSNKGVSFILVAIDCFTKKAFVRGLKKKTADLTLAAIKDIFKSMQPPPRAVLFDRGREFVNKDVDAYLEKKKIKRILPGSELKACIAERFNRTLQDLIYPYLDENNTDKYIDVLQKLVQTYNDKEHSTIGMTPNEAEKDENSAKVLCALNLKYTKVIEQRKEPKFAIGQTVRVAGGVGDKMKRGYNARFNLEHYKIIDINRRLPIPMYKLKSMNDDEIIDGNFYEGEITPVYGDVFKMKVIKQRVTKGKKEFLVSWKGFDERHNSWIPAEAIRKDYRSKQ
ncbi:MAG TPA: DDE-type integrase/transposase/recombinase [Ignavibacteriaceae bacterium]